VARGAQLEQHAARRGRVQEGHLVTAGAEAGRLVDEAHAGGLEAGEGGGQVVDLEADVVQAGAARVEESLQALVAGGRADLERRAVSVREQEGDVGLLVRDVLVRPRGQAESI
jgi:hypothetical protein